VKYAFIQHSLAESATAHRLGLFCRMLEVSRSGYYDWVERSRKPQPDTIALDTAARAAHQRGRESYGPKRLRAELAEMGFTRSLSAVKRLRRRLSLRCRHKSRFVRTTDSNHTWPIAPNLLEQRFDQTSARNQVWVTDITYIATDEGWLYVAAIKDLFNKKIVGWAMADHMRTALVSQALWMAVKQERPLPGLIHHSDRGSQYAGGEYRQLIEQFGMKASMSRRGNCYDNAPMESFWASLKKEQVNHQHYATRAAAKADIFDYIACFYNTTRRHSALGYQSPNNFNATIEASETANLTNTSNAV
jgi:putative transposase